MPINIFHIFFCTKSCKFAFILMERNKMCYFLLSHLVFINKPICVAPISNKMHFGLRQIVNSFISRNYFNSRVFRMFILCR